MTRARDGSAQSQVSSPSVETKRGKKRRRLDQLEAADGAEKKRGNKDKKGNKARSKAGKKRRKGR